MAEVPACHGGGSHDESGDQSPRPNFREPDRYLPIANISRIMKKVLPANGKIAKDARETVQECVSEFIIFITSEASDKCQREKRKTINGDDLFWAMATLGFEDYVDPLKIYLSGYREVDQKLCSRYFNLYKFAVAYPPVSSSSERLMLSSSFFPRSNSSHGLDRVKQMEGDTKGSVKGGDSSARKDATGAQHGPNAQAQHMMVPMQGNSVDMSS